MEIEDLIPIPTFLSKMDIEHYSTQPTISVSLLLKSSLVHYRLMTFNYFAIFSSSKQLSGYCNCLGQKRSFT